MNKVKLNKKGTNATIKATILSDTQMKNIGFTDHNKKEWYYCRMVGDEISFNVTIPKNGADIEIVTLDENFCQPYDYQCILERSPSFKYAQKIKNNVEKEMDYLQRCGVLSGHEYGEYI